MFLPTRYLLVVETFCLSVLLYVDRACIAAAKDAVVQEFLLTDVQWAWIVEGLTTLSQLSQSIVEFIALPLRIVGGGGSPVRAIAIEASK